LVAGFSTTSKTRPLIISKLDDYFREKTVIVRSSRLIDELFTFIYSSGRAEAMKGYNDDLVMALAIGIWLFDTDTDYSSRSQEVTRAMIAAFAVNKKSDEQQPPVPHPRNPMSPIMVDALPGWSASSANPYAHFGWVIKG
jgi:hypothetical protein